MTLDRQSSVDRNSIAFWFPKVQAAGIRVPQTALLHSPDLTALLDGPSAMDRLTRHGHQALIEAIQAAGDQLGWPCFLRTGHGSGKHEWRHCCYLADPAHIGQHVYNLVEWSHLVDMMGLSTDVWAVRELIPTAPLFVCEGFAGFPVTREFRVFVLDGGFEHVQPYWPPDSVAQGRPEDPSWRALLDAASRLKEDEMYELSDIAEEAGRAVGGGYWSVDLLQDQDGEWWLTDMAEGDRSFRWEPTP